MNVLINQPAGLGDILFCQKIAHVAALKGDTVFWPLNPVLNYVPTYVSSPVNWSCPNKADCIWDLQNASNLVLSTGDVMADKYALIGLPFDDWKSYVKIIWPPALPEDVRDFVHQFREYNCMVRTFGTPPWTYYTDFAIDNGLPTYEIRIQDKTPFDYCYIISNATELHFVDTCFTHIAELIETKARRMCLYPRKPIVQRGMNFNYDITIKTKSLWSKPWEYME